MHLSAYDSVITKVWTENYLPFPSTIPVALTPDATQQPTTLGHVFRSPYSSLESFRLVLLSGPQTPVSPKNHTKPS